MKGEYTNASSSSKESVIALLQQGQQAFAATNYNAAVTLFNSVLIVAGTQQHQQALAIHREIGARTGEARVLLNIGVLHDGNRILIARFALVVDTATARDNLTVDDAQWTVARLSVSKAHQGVSALTGVPGGAEVESFGALAQKRGAKGVLAETCRYRHPYYWAPFIPMEN